MNKKKLMIIPLLFVLGSCTYGSYSMIGGVKKTTNSEISASYKKFSGYFARKFKIKNAGEKYVFTFTCTTLEENEGTLRPQQEDEVDANGKQYLSRQVRLRD